ncbi:hypothetical protein VMCG_08360 [Cytospora schulzeri]|uniref:Uncharacterized protein n=1 Tax=Cytospora schulzeri TaxID=448051 RepID=A0A423VV71_9PEZI|nr:hypothetical protein VMCG_08360 [Valsa malicola]
MDDMDPAIELAEAAETSQSPVARDTVGVEGQQHSIRRKPIQSWSNDEVANNNNNNNNTGHCEAPDNQPSPSRPLMASDDATGYRDQKVPTIEASSCSDDASNTHGSERYLPPRQLSPLTNAQILLLFGELLAVLAIFISGIKGLTMLPQSNIFSIPPISEDCGGYSVPSVERSFYVNLQIVKNLSFTRAKLLDLGWDTIIGQGGKYLHGWILYRVAASQLAWMMEYSSIPYHFQLNLMFSTVSLPALWSTIRFLSVKRPARTVVSAVWFLLAISYILAFSSIWSAATGYLNPSIPAYRMADNTYVTVDSDGLRVCMAVDTERLNGSVPAIVLGPRIGEIVKSLSDLPLGWSPRYPRQNSSDGWLDLLAYYDTKYRIQAYFEDAPKHMVNETADLNDYEYVVTADDGTPYVFHDTGGYSREIIEGLYREFTGFQFPGVGQHPKYANGTDALYFNATFQFDPSVNISGLKGYDVLEPLPYNSTLWYNGKAIALDAPFLSMSPSKDFCEWFAYDGPCLCYGDSLLTEDFRGDNDENLICISEEGYVWGFSSVVTLVGIILEVCWMLGCFGMWMDVHINSTLFRMNRPSSGTVRNLLDIAGAIQRDLGGDTGAYRDRELKKALEECPPVGFEVVDDGGKVDRIAMVSMPGVRRRSSRVKIEANRLYA